MRATPADHPFLKRKMGLGQHQPTIIYQEHQTAIQTMHNTGSISKAYRECQWTLEPSLYKQFSFLENWMTRFAIRQLHHHQQMWEAVISLKYNLENNSHETWEPNTEQSTERCRNKELDVNYICKILVRYSNTRKWTDTRESGLRNTNRLYRIGDNCGWSSADVIATQLTLSEPREHMQQRHTSK